MSKLSKAIANAIIEFNSGLLTQDELFDKLERDIDNVSVKVWRKDKSVPLPTYGKEGDACCDVYAKNIEIKQDDRIVVHTGLHFALPDNYEMELRPRSSFTKGNLVMQNSPGTLDESYRGELVFVFRGLYDLEVPIVPKEGERVGQLLVRRREKITWDEVETLEELGTTERGVKGFGSTGK
jgi:dUTP diphosphatase